MSLSRRLPDLNQQSVFKTSNYVFKLASIKYFTFPFCLESNIPFQEIPGFSFFFLLAFFHYYYCAVTLKKVHVPLFCLPFLGWIPNIPMEFCTFITRLMFNSTCKLLIHLTSTCYFGHSVKTSIFGKSLQ